MGMLKSVSLPLGKSVTKEELAKFAALIPDGTHAMVNTRVIQADRPYQSGSVEVTLTAQWLADE